MKNKKVTIQDIADALDLSRNTVSKALNGSNSIPEVTRSKVMEMAAKLKYKHYEYVNTSIETNKGPYNIALFTSNMPNSSHFGSLLLSGLEKRISEEGYNLSIHILRDSEISSLSLPNNFEVKNVSGIICIELFNKKYSDLISSLDLPTIFIDSTADISFHELNADILLMENEFSTYTITKELIQMGHKEIGFIGDYNHCRSFNERWLGYNRAHSTSDVTPNLSLCIIEDDHYPYGDPNWIIQHLDNMPKIPSAFICANDFIAISVIKALKTKNIKIGIDVAICGFDDSQEASIVDPPLTTVHIYNSEMGIIGAEMLISRLKNPTKPYQLTYVKTMPIYRESTHIHKDKIS